MKAIIELQEKWITGNLKTLENIEHHESTQELLVNVYDKITTKGREQFFVKKINDKGIVIACENFCISEITERGTISLLSKEKEFTLSLNEQKAIAICITDYGHSNYFTLKEIIKEKNTEDTYVEINLNNIKNNALNIIKEYPDYKYYIGVLKADAYGHGYYIVNEMVAGGINYIAVFDINEALLLRKYNKDVPVLCFEPVPFDRIEEAVSNNITVTVHEIDYLDKLNNLDMKDKLKIHIKVDSGMNRLGFKDKDEIKKAADIINDNSSLYLEGIYSHFMTTGVFDNKWDMQVTNFKELTSLIDLKEVPIVHLANSLTLVAHPKIDFCNGVRSGILLYGYNVTPESSNTGIKNILRNMRNKYYKKRFNISETYTNVEIDVKPAMSFYTKIIQIKEVKKGEFVGYNARYQAESNQLIAVIKAGYASGIGRDNFNKTVYINNKEYPVIGDLGMNMIVAKIDSDVSLNDKVLLLGDKITLGQFSRGTNLSLSEVLLGIGRNNKRIYVKDNNVVYIEGDKNV